MSTALYAIGDMRDVLDQWLAESDGEVTPELEELMADNDQRFEEKVESVALYIRERIGAAKMAEAERDRIAAIATREKKAAESLKQYLASQMSRMGKKRVDGKLVTVAFQANPPSVKGTLGVDQLIELHQMSFADPRCVVNYTPESYALDRSAVLSLHRQGLPIPDGLTVTQELSLRIK